MKILLVEDDFVSRKILLRTLQPMGECDMACNGMEAWTAFQAAQKEGAPYSLVLLDIMMPEMDGSEVLRRIREYEETSGLYGTARARIAMATGYGSKDNILASFKGQCDGFIRKPYTPATILSDLRRQGLLDEASIPGQS